MMKENKGKYLVAEIWKARYIYLLILPVLIWLAVFNYAPMYGIILAFKKYKVNMGILGSPWVGLKNFERMFQIPDTVASIKATLVISFQRLIFEFPVPIILAILITEMPGKRVKKIYQTIYTLPHFLSWIVVGSIINVVLMDKGLINMLLASVGFEKIQFLGKPALFRPILYITQNWKEMGWSAIIYMAAIAGVDPELYDAAKVDGASRLRQIFSVTLPGISTTIVIMLILAIGGMMNGGFEQIFTLRNALVRDAANTLDIYIYDKTFGTANDYGFVTAVGLFKAVINVILLLVANWASGKVSGHKMFE